MERIAPWRPVGGAGREKAGFGEAAGSSRTSTWGGVSSCKAGGDSQEQTLWELM